MRTWNCKCGAELFFHNTRCVACGREVGLCEACRQLHSADVIDQPSSYGPAQTILQCPEHADARLVRCRLGLDHALCNRFTLADVGNANPSSRSGACTWCQLTTDMPPLSDALTQQKVRRLEAAKRRVLYIVDQIGLPVLAMPGELPLSFRFLGSEDADEPIMTGHGNGVITINIREADSVHREATRVEFGEPHRTLVGHLRHELGHYYWQRMVQPKPDRLTRYRELFGDERDPSYVDAIKAYYDRGHVGHWQSHFVSQYATMHSWEDFAESFNAYLDLRTVLATAAHFIHRGSIRRRGRISPDASNTITPEDPFERMIADYARVGIVANEFNRDLGLLDLVPEVFTTAVVEKLRFIHQLCNPAAATPVLG
ncbi:MAG: putative zinc-binding metallopeptidase [Planctomycetota bacterium]